MSKTIPPIPKSAAGKTRRFSPGPAAKGAVAQAVKNDAGKIDAALVLEIANLLSQSDLTEIEVEKGDLRIRVSRQNALVAQTPHFAPAFAAPAHSVAHVGEAHEPADAHAAADVLKSPMVGTVYLRPSPDAKAFIELGTHVVAGQKVLLIEAMKTFNDIVAHRSGAVSAILVEDGQPVEYGQPLLVIA